MTLAVGMGFFATTFVSSAVAGCGDLQNLQRPFDFVKPGLELRQQMAMGEDASQQRGGPGKSIVGMWKVQFISHGNGGHVPPIPDGALIDFGYSQWHADGTEILNSGGHSPAGGNWCLGVWEQTGPLTFALNHFPIAYNSATGMISNYINIREQITVAPSGNSYAGTFTLDVYDPLGNPVDHLTGTIVASRITVNTPISDAIPNK
jgi:hypothetical protein